MILCVDHILSMFSVRLVLGVRPCAGAVHGLRVWRAVRPSERCLRDGWHNYRVARQNGSGGLTERHTRKPGLHRHTQRAGCHARMRAPRGINCAQGGPGVRAGLPPPAWIAARGAHLRPLCAQGTGGGYAAAVSGGVDPFTTRATKSALVPASRTPQDTAEMCCFGLDISHKLVI